MVKLDRRAWFIGLVALVCLIAALGVGFAFGRHQSVSFAINGRWIDRADLAAQQWMATWAMWMFVASVGGVLVSIVSVVLLRASLREAARAADHAARAADAAADNNAQTRSMYVLENRPWLNIELELTSNSRQFDKTMGINLMVTTENVGKTPAINLRTSTLCHESPGPNDHLSNLVTDLLTEMVVAHGSGSMLAPGAKLVETFELTLMPDQYSTFEMMDDERRHFSEIVVGATYETVLDKEIRSMGRAYFFSMAQTLEDEALLRPSHCSLTAREGTFVLS
ncbi:MAG TPA: hypothetical protein VIL88_05795 [Devosia sp.]|jgi:hypothetical protein|uniref:hypothetical protein n=1 Tax=Devosia sp. TaxID=1871048 RepID=UPI002F952E9A